MILIKLTLNAYSFLIGNQVFLKDTQRQRNRAKNQIVIKHIFSREAKAKQKKADLEGS